MVENIEKPRQPYPSYEAIYILTPCIESCSRLVDDFSRAEGPMYAAAHVHFINGKKDRQKKKKRNDFLNYFFRCMYRLGKQHF